MPREPAPDHDIIAFGRSIEEVTKLRQEMLKVAIHREHISTTGRRESVGNSQAYAVGRDAMERPYSIVFRSEHLDNFARSVSAPVIHRNHLMDVLAIKRHELFRQWSDVHFLVVTRNDDRNRAAQRFVLKQRDLAQLFTARRLLGMDKDRSSHPADNRGILQQDRQIAQKPD